MKISFVKLLRLLGVMLVIILIFLTISIKKEIIELRKEIKNTQRIDSYPSLFAKLDTESSKKEWNEYVIKDCNTINNVLNLTEDQLDNLASNNTEIYFKNDLEKYKIIFSTQIINRKWINCGFIAPVEVINIHNITSDNEESTIFEKFITKRLGTSSWIYLNDQEVKSRIFMVLKNSNYDENLGRISK